MWARVVEFMLACWLALSPFILHYPSEATALWTSDLVCAFLVALFALLSFWHPLRKIHLCTLGVGLWLWGLGYQDFPLPASIPQENSVVLGLLLLMLAIIPCHSHRSPLSWQEFLETKKTPI